SHKTTKDERRNAAAIEKPLIAVHGEQRVDQTGRPAGSQGRGTNRHPKRYRNRAKDGDRRTGGGYTSESAIKSGIGGGFGGAVSTAGPGAFLRRRFGAAHPRKARAISRQAAYAPSRIPAKKNNSTQ